MTALKEKSTSRCVLPCLNALDNFVDGLNKYVSKTRKNSEVPLAVDLFGAAESYCDFIDNASVSTEAEILPPGEVLPPEPQKKYAEEIRSATSKKSEVKVNGAKPSARKHQ
jgi:hypothetical protein